MTPDACNEHGLNRNAWLMLRPLGTPLPLGLLALCAATTGASTVQLGWVPAQQATTIGLILLAFAAPLQLLSAIFGFLARDPVAGTGMAFLAGTWAVLGLSWHLSPAAAATLSPAVGVLLVVAAAGILVPTAASIPGKATLTTVMVAAAARLALTGAYEFGAGPWAKTAGGWVGIATAALAWYAALAFELEGVHHRQVLPTFRLGPAKNTMSETFAAEADGALHDAGVRKTL